MPLPHLMLDTGPLGRLAHGRPRPDIIAWIASVRTAYEVIIPEIADYEVRRSLVASKLSNSLVQLDRWKSTLTYAPITTTAMLLAAQMWADARQRGMPTADPRELDGDVILAAQAIETNAIVATENLGHLTRYVQAYHWSTIVP
jgi:predicted nucleic acid-binding protein